jgi:hypothetical protein
VLIDVITIIASLAAVGATASGSIIASSALKTGNAARFATLLGARLYLPLVGTNLAADAAQFIVMSASALHDYNEAMATGDEQARDLALERLVAQLLVTGGMTLLAVKGNIADFRRGRNLYLHAVETTATTAKSEVSRLANAGAEMPAGDAIRRYNIGSGFSGAYDPQTGRFVALASGDATLANGQPVQTVPQFGGHAAAEGALGAADPRKNVGFVVIWEGSDTVRIRWNSRTINERNFGTPAAPMEVRPAIKAAVGAATRCTVVE